MDNKIKVDLFCGFGTLCKENPDTLRSYYNNAMNQAKSLDLAHALGEVQLQSLYDIVEQTMTSLEIAELTGKSHSHLMRDIRNMEPAWEKVNGTKFGLVDYRDKKGESRPCYQLTIEDAQRVRRDQGLSSSPSTPTTASTTSGAPR